MQSNLRFAQTQLHKLPTNGTMAQLPIRPIVSNKDVASYRLANHFANKLSLFGQCTYIIQSTFDFTGKIKNEKIPLRLTMVSFDVKLL